MADARRFADLRYGHVGKLTYIPRDDRISGEPGTLHTSRLTSNCPHFQQVGSSAELYPASKSAPPLSTHSHLWAERNLQKRWLLKSHPEALMGNPELSGLLTEENQRFRKLEDAPSTQPLLAIGQMTDYSKLSRPTVAPVLAAATGESGELLRLARIQDSQWAWEDATDCTLHLSVIDPMDQDDEMIWTNDGLPISQVKFAISVSSTESIRWLLVQKQTSTTILRPEYTKVPKAESRSYEKSKRILSRISPNPMVALSHRETGGNAHADVAFNAPADDSPPQLCVVDECGYWTLWNIQASSRTDKKKLRMALYRCGHIWEGALTAIPTTPLYPAEKHGVLFVGGQREDDIWGENFPGLESPNGTVLRAAHIVVWNSERFEIIDTETNSSLPAIPEFSSAKLRFDRILDIRLSPVNQNHVLILTARFIVWVDVFHRFGFSNSGTKPAILLTCPHGAAPRDDLKMATNRSTDDDDANPMVSVYSSSDGQVSIHWFSLTPESDLPQWHSQVTSLSQSARTTRQPFAIQELILQPQKLTCPSTSPGVGSRYRRDGVQFYQGMMLGQDLGIQYCMCFASENLGLEVTLPVDRVGHTKSNQNRRWRRKRQDIFRHMGESVVVPDSMTDGVIEWLSRTRWDKEPEPLEAAVKSAPQHPANPIRLNVDVLARAIGELVRGRSDQLKRGLPTELLEAFQGAVQHGHAAGRLPLMTWREIADDVESDGETELIPAEQIEGAIQSFLHGAGDQTVVTRLARRQQGEPDSPLGSLSQIINQLTSIWLDPLKGRLPEEDLRLREAWVAELSRDLFLSLHGIAVQDVPLFGPEPPAPTQDSHQSIPSSMPIPSSQHSLSTPPLSPSNSSSAAAPDEAFQRLQLLAPSIQPGALGASKQASVLSLWPTERGVSTKDYTSSVAIASDKKLDPARERLQRMEARRKAFSEKYRRPSSMRQGFPEIQLEEGTIGTPMRPPASTQIMSSPQLPPSSQSQGPPVVSMSQPVAGAFGGDRKKKAKKTKKKSGFR